MGLDSRMVRAVSSTGNGATGSRGTNESRIWNRRDLDAALLSCRFQTIASNCYLGQVLMFDLAAVRNKPNPSSIAPLELQARRAWTSCG